MRLNGKVSNPGEMSTQISIQTRTVTTETGGFQAPSWTTLATVWAKWVGAHGSESWAAQSIGAEAAATVTIRYLAGVDTTCAVLLGNEQYEIISMDNIRQRDEFLELKVRRLRSG